MTPIQTFLQRTLSSGSPWLIGQVVLHRLRHGQAASIYDVRHELDRDRRDLRRLNSLSEVEEMVRWTDHSEYRPIKGAPNLATGWRVEVSQIAVLVEVLHVIYPGCLAYLAAGQARIDTPWEATLGRQRGRLRPLIELSPEVRTDLVRTFCDRQCLRTPCWAGAAPSPQAGRLPLLCTEACPALLEHALRQCQPDSE